MSITRVGSGKYRVQVWDRRVHKNVALSKITPGTPALFASKKAAKAARDQARQRIEEMIRPDGPTLRAFADRWARDRLFRRPKESTDLQNHWAVREFVAAYGHLPIRQIGHEVVAEYLAGGSRSHRVGALRALWSDAKSAKAGRLVDHNPWERLGLQASTGNRHNDPPAENVVRALVAAARLEGGPCFAAWLQTAAFTGLRPGELDALAWEHIDFDRGRITVQRQFNAGSRKMTVPKNGKTREAVLTPPARDALDVLPRTSEFCFVAPRGGHYTAASRRAPWKRTREQVGYTGTLYLATRHHAGSYMVNVLGLTSEDVAFALGHSDGGELVRRLYGHRDREQALQRVARAFDGRANVVELKAVKDAT